MSNQLQGCREHRELTRISRRAALQFGVLGGCGLALPELLRRKAQAASTHTPKAKSVILMWLQGGVSHHETFDTKPDAPSDVRGEFHSIKSNLPGVQVGEYLPRISQVMDRLAVIRSVTHSEAAHQRGSMYMVEGRRPPKATGVEHSGHPEIGSIVAHELGMRNGIPPFMSIPGNDFTSRFTGPGFLPAKSECFRGYNAAGLATPEGFSADRFRERVELHRSLAQGEQARMAKDVTGQSWDAFFDQAVDIVASAKAAEAFDLSSESAEIHRLYGSSEADSGTRTRLGSLTLTARRLVEAGVRYVTIGQNSWDHHSNIFPQLKIKLPAFDAAFSGLVLDLEQRGMLDETLVIYMTEYGRTPKVNGDGGRDHWPRAFSIAFAGAGIQAGQVIGSSDKIGGDVTDHPVSPEEIAATILHLVGINPQSHFVGRDNRPLPYVDYAQPIQQLLS